MSINTIQSHFEPTRTQGLKRLAAFLPVAGRDYAQQRNTDRGSEDRSNVSMLSPYIRHRLITEREVLEAVLSRHSLSSAEKFIHEVFWRSYFKGHLEANPQVWRRYCVARDWQIEAVQSGGMLAKQYACAITGQTGIDCFDAWVTELKETGYLHNHARMWFASIWIFTLKLPWELGADFTYRHFLDGDAASNTLSWRWVGGLHTKGKTYLARSSNIQEYTNGRFSPKGLASEAIALEETPCGPDEFKPKKASLMPLFQAPSGPALFLLSDDDLCPESLSYDAADIRCVVAMDCLESKSGLAVSSLVHDFVDGAMTDGLRRAELHFNTTALKLKNASRDRLIQLAHAYGAKHILVPYAPTGLMRDTLSTLEPALAQNGIALVYVCREEDRLIWPHAKKGFFSLKERIPELLQAMRINKRPVDQDDLFAEAMGTQGG